MKQCFRVKSGDLRSDQLRSSGQAATLKKNEVLIII